MIGTLLSTVLGAIGKSVVGKTLLKFAEGFLERGLLLVLAAVAAVAVVQTLRLQNCQSALRNCEVSHAVANASASILYANSLGEESQNYVQKQLENAPVVERVVERTRNICLHNRGVSGSLPGATAVSGPAGSEIKNGREHEEWLALVAEDLRTCQAELNRLDFIRNLHNASVMP